MTTEKAMAVDIKALGKVAVLMGGRSAEREVSLMSGNGVLAALQSKGVDAHAFDPAEREMSELKRDGFDRCFIALHGRFGEDGTVQGALELMGIPYTGPGVMASSVAMDKVMTKRIWSAVGLPTPGWRQVGSAAETREAFVALGSPMIVKPAREGSTIGLTKVVDAAQCEEAYRLAAQHDLVHAHHQGAEHEPFRHPGLEVARAVQLLVQPAPFEGLGIGRELVAGTAGRVVLLVKQCQSLLRAGHEVTLIEAKPDVGAGTSKANTAIWHTGFDAKPGTREAGLVARGHGLLTERAGEDQLRHLEKIIEERLRQRQERDA